MTLSKTLNILGCRGIPARHGGFETFAERLAVYMAEHGWSVNVYCQSEGEIAGMPTAHFVDEWRNIKRTHIRSSLPGPAGTIAFDFAATRDVLRQPGIDLVLGYNTAVFMLAQKLQGRTVLVNMDGLEWRRDKWSWPAKMWLLANERIAARWASKAIADHPEIALHLQRNRETDCIVIPYGADAITDGTPDTLSDFDVEPNRYLIVVARIEPENSILEIVEAFSKRKRGRKLLVIGSFEPGQNSYHRKVGNEAGSEVIFAGPVYDRVQLQTLRFFASAYVHGHRVGGTNPSLVEALGAGNPVIAHDNVFNRWTAGKGQKYFSSPEDCGTAISDLLSGNWDTHRASNEARNRFQVQFRWEIVLENYRELLEAHCD